MWKSNIVAVRWVLANRVLNLTEVRWRILFFRYSNKKIPGFVEVSNIDNCDGALPVIFEVTITRRVYLEKVNILLIEVLLKDIVELFDTGRKEGYSIIGQGRPTKF